LTQLFWVIIYETQHAKTGRDWPVKQRYGKLTGSRHITCWIGDVAFHNVFQMKFAPSG